MMQIARGTVQPDKSYRYTCSKCRGSGLYRGYICDWCYALDLDMLRYNLRTARGKRYYALLKAILSIIGKQIVDDAKTIERERGDFRVYDLGWLCHVHDLNLTALGEWLEEARVIPNGTTDEIKRHVRVRDVIAAGIKAHSGKSDE